MCLEWPVIVASTPGFLLCRGRFSVANELLACLQGIGELPFFAVAKLGIVR